jgi:hypothetical protein
MKKAKFCAVALIVSAALTATSAFGQARVPPLQPPPPRDLPSAEENPELVPSNASESPEATGTTLSPPVAITYKGNSTALGITDSGSGSGLSSTLSNRSDNGSAVFGGTVGGGAGITGIASGPTGFGGVFEITDSSNGAAAVSAISSGTGSAILGKLVGESSEYQAAIAGANVGSSRHGVGVEGLGNYIGVYAIANNINGFGVLAKASAGIAVAGEDTGGGIGVYGSSSGGFAGYFDGTVEAKSYLTLSDRNAKTDFAPIDGSAVLERISRLPVTSWAFKNEPNIRHVGPTAQDFYAAFGLSGEDDKHINLTDSTGVSLAAIQELNKRLQEKDARIAALERQVESLNDTLSARLTKLEKQVAAAP